MADINNVCLVCKEATLVRNRRLVCKEARVLCQELLLRDVGVEESCVPMILQQLQYMCRKCGRKMDEHIKQKKLLIQSLEDIAKDLYPTSSIKECTSAEASTAKRRKVILGSSTSSTTVSYSVLANCTFMLHYI